MPAPHLATKLYLPAPTANLVERPRLTGRLADSLTRSLTLVSAPAGYGKTTLVSQWLHAQNRPAAWLLLDEGDNDPARFLSYLVKALQKISPGLGEGLLGALQGIQPVSYEGLVSALINEVADVPEDFLLILDDFHTIQAQPVLELLAFLLDHRPSQMHLVLLSRTDPPLPMSRLRVRNQLVEVRVDHLRFNLEEVTAFLNEIMHLGLSNPDLAAMEKRTEGWVAGLQLAAISLQGREDVHGFVSAFTGSHHYIVDYLVEEVLNRQPEAVRSFLLQTSILERMSEPLCNAVTGQVDGQAMLESLERANLFLIPLDDERCWFRYHPLFADVLDKRLRQTFPDQLTELHRRAAVWYDQNGFTAEAIEHALRAEDWGRAAGWIERNGFLLLLRGELITLLKWTTAVDNLLPVRPWLAIQKAWALILTGQPENMETLLRMAEERIPTEQLPQAVLGAMLGSISAARAYQANQEGDAHRARDFARQSLESLPESNQATRSVVTFILGNACWMSGDLDGARNAYAEAIRIAQAAGNLHLVIVASSDLADLLLEQGKLHQAVETYQESLKLTTSPDGQYLPVAGRVFAGLGKVSYEWNDLQAAEQHYLRCIELCRQWGSVDYQSIGHAMLARLYYAQKDPERAVQAMDQAKQLARQHHLALRWSSEVEATQARLWVALGNLEAVNGWIQERGLQVGDEVPFQREAEYCLLARWLLAQGDPSGALTLLERMLHSAEKTGRSGRIIELLVLQALAFWDRGELPRSLEVLERALSMARPEGYMRVFLDEGEPMMSRMEDLRLWIEDRGLGMIGEKERSPRGREFEELKVYIDELLATYYPSRPGMKDQPSIKNPQTATITPLSSRELEVLRCIAAGLSNQDIASRLVIELSTVKRHISNIYNKLGVESRTQALARGKELGLLE